MLVIVFQIQFKMSVYLLLGAVALAAFRKKNLIVCAQALIRTCEHRYTQ